MGIVESVEDLTQEMELEMKDFDGKLGKKPSL